MALAATAVVGLAACSSTPKYVNPVELYRSTAGFSLNDDTTGERNAQNLEAGSRQPYPNLGTVPPPPDRAMSSIDRQKLQQGLTEDRAQAKQTDAGLRDSSASAAAAAPKPITRPGSVGPGAAASESKAGADAARAGGLADAGKPRSRKSRGSETAPEEAELSSPSVHPMPEGDAPRPAPPPPSLAPPAKANKPATDHMAKPLLPPIGKRPAPDQTAAVNPKPEVPSPRAAMTPNAAGANTAPAAGTPPAASSTSADEAARIPPPPPADMMASAPAKSAATDPMHPASPPSNGSAPAADTKTAAAAPRPTSPPPVAAAAPSEPWPPSLGPSDAPPSPSAQAVTPQPVRPTQQQTPAAPSPGPTVVKPPEQQQALTPPVQAAPQAPQPEQQQAALAPPTQAAPRAPQPEQQQAALTPPMQAAPQAPQPEQQQAALTPPMKAAPVAPQSEMATAAPAPPRPSRAGTVSMQAAEIKFADNGLALTADDDRRLADVVKLYDKHGGVVRVVGYGRRGYGVDAAQQELASFSKAIERANVVARALTQLGLASNRIVVQAAPIGDGLGEDRAEVLLEF